MGLKIFKLSCRYLELQEGKTLSTNKRFGLNTNSIIDPLMVQAITTKCACLMIGRAKCPIRIRVRASMWWEFMSMFPILAFSWSRVC